MNKTGLWMIKLMILGIISSSMVIAQGDEALRKIDVGAGITPDSFLYRIDLFFEGLQLDFAKTNEDRSRLHLKFASERIAEIKELEKNDKDSNLIKKTAERYEKSVDNAQAWGRSISILARQKDFELLLQAATSIHTQVLERVQEKLTEKRTLRTTDGEVLIDVGVERQLIDVKKVLESAKKRNNQSVKRIEGLNKRLGIDNNEGKGSD